MIFSNEFTDKLTVEGTKAYLEGSLWGILRGLETFSQLIYESIDHFTVRRNNDFIELYWKL